MALYGILKSMKIHTGNTGLDNELACVFTTPLSIESKQAYFSVDTISMRRLSRRTAAQRWELEAGISQVDSSTNFLVMSSIKGAADPFYVRMPQPRETFKTTENVPLLTVAAYAKNASKVKVHHAAFVGKTLPPGMFIQFSGHPKVYLVQESVLDNTYNELTLFPILTKDVILGERLYYGAQVSMKSLFDPSVKMGISYENGFLSGVSGLKIVESL